MKKKYAKGFVDCLLIFHDFPYILAAVAILPWNNEEEKLFYGDF